MCRVVSSHCLVSPLVVCYVVLSPCLGKPFVWSSRLVLSRLSSLVSRLSSLISRLSSCLISSCRPSSPVVIRCVNSFVVVPLYHRVSCRPIWSNRLLVIINCCLVSSHPSDKFVVSSRLFLCKLLGLLFSFVY